MEFLSKSKLIRIILWTALWAIGGAIIGLADDQVGVGEGLLLGAFWGVLLAFIYLSGWSLWKE
jgi:hypothetical protein